MAHIEININEWGDDVKWKWDEECRAHIHIIVLYKCKAILKY